MKKEIQTATGRREIDFIGKASAFGMLSVVLVIISLGIIFTKGFQFGIDFSGGTEVQVKFTEPVDAGQVRSFAEGLVSSVSVQGLGERGDEYLLRFEMLEGETDEEINRKNNELIERVTSAFLAEMPMTEDGLLRVDSVGPQVGSTLKRDAVLSIFYALIVILIYVGLRFDYRYAPGAVLCLFHDVIVTLGIYSLFQLEVNMQVLAAVLTIVGYSINDTIVVFDRIRENLGIHRDMKLPALINRSVNETLSRTLLTSGSTLVSVALLYFLADGVIRDLSLTLGIGVVLGVYSTLYAASPSLILIDRWSKNRARRA